MHPLLLVLLYALQALIPPTWQIESDAGCIADPNGTPRCSP